MSPSQKSFDNTKIRRALLSCTDKTGLVDFAKFLQSQGTQILSTGKTAKTLREAGITVTEVSDATGQPELFDGRVKTLHPKIHGGLLFRRGQPDHEKQALEHHIEPIDLLVVTLYEFSKTVEKGCTLSEAIENIDIGGPALLRSAAKNHESVTVICHPDDYSVVQEEIKKNGTTLASTRLRLATRVFAATSNYDHAISDYLQNLSLQKSQESKTVFPDQLELSLQKIQDLRYGENPHQKAAFYKTADAGLSQLVQHQGKELSFNNLLDTEAAYRCVLEFEEPACVVVKHNNPCGVAIGNDLLAAFTKAKACDPVSSFGGIIAFNRTLDQATAQKIGETFFEVILAPAFETAALATLADKKNLRLLSLENFFANTTNSLDVRIMNGIALCQESDQSEDKISKIAHTVTDRAPTEQEWQDLQFVWSVAKHVKSNAIIFGKNGQTLGIGAGQMSRIDATRIAALKAQDAWQTATPLQGSVLASDAFFPFRDGLDAAAQHGITAVIQPGGSLRDNEVIAAANEHKIAMVFTGRRHFRH